MSQENKNVDLEEVWRSWNSIGPVRNDNHLLKTEIGRRIAARRALLGHTQQELADRMGVARSQITAWETGRNGISAEDLPWIAHHLWTGASDILGGLPAPQDTLLTRIASLSQSDQELILRLVESLERRK